MEGVKQIEGTEYVRNEEPQSITACETRPFFLKHRNLELRKRTGLDEHRGM